MIKLIALYKKPADVEAFEAHYREVHLPLVQKVPGLVRAEVTRIKMYVDGMQRFKLCYQARPPHPYHTPNACLNPLLPILNPRRRSCATRPCSPPA